MIARLLRLVLALQIGLGALLGAGLTEAFAAPHPGAIQLACGALIGVCASFLGHPLVIAIDFAITRRVRSPIPKALQLSPGEALRTYAMEVAAGMRGFSWAHPFLQKRRAPSPAVQTQPLPLLFIHGYFCNRAIWLPFMRAAAQAGFVSEAITLEPPFDRIDSYIGDIEAAVAALLCRSGAPSLIIVAHSMGGLAARAWMRRFGAQRVARLITLGSPHAGTVMAGLGHTGNVGQMRRDSAWLRQLRADETDETRQRIVCLFSYHDNIVAPQLSATLEGATNIALSGIGHVRLVYHPRVRKLVLDEARSASTAVSCAVRAVAGTTHARDS